MILNLVMVIVNRTSEDVLLGICEDLGLHVSLTMMGHGMAKSEHLEYYGLEATEKVAFLTFADGEKTQALIKSARRKLSIDIPGNGILACVPIKSVGGGRTLAYLTGDGAPGGGSPDIGVSHELIICILNHSYTDDVMAAARSAGASGGTVLHGKGTGADYARQFLGVSLASEKEILLIVAASEDKSAIMRAIAEKTGPQTPAGAISISLPVTEVAGLRGKI
ncbi:MAG: P-II family nitrogen regulator [Clostridiales bacterium]|nr:P-II family nitrogen regulator [Clostridiales bacterium]